MNESTNYQKMKEAREKKQRYLPFILVAVAILMVIGGGMMVFMWWNGSGKSIALFSTDTPTVTITNTMPPPTETPTITMTPTATLSPTLESTSTAAAPFAYVVQEGDTISGLAERFGLDEVYGPLIIMVFNGLSNQSSIFTEDTLIIPDPNTGLPSPTPLPQLPAGSVIEYLILPGDTLPSIAEKFLSTEDGIIKENDLVDPNALYYGNILYVPIRLITPTYGPSPTPSPGPGTPSATPYLEASSTPIPPLNQLPIGAIIDYQVKSGDNLVDIADQFLADIDDIATLNDLDEYYTIYPDQVLKIRVNMVAPVPTATPTNTSTPGA
ncbi:MAG: LysM peptidoglycan-binding domain-containing protein [Anaerolineales bacterium]|nr:LysM peptidoglycan-binding domain-containing protein [Anaerolineales bacterium]